MGPNEGEMGLKEEVEEEEAIAAAAVVVREVREEGRIDDNWEERSSNGSSKDDWWRLSSWRLDIKQRVPSKSAAIFAVASILELLLVVEPLLLSTLNTADAMSPKRLTGEVGEDDDDTLFGWEESGRIFKGLDEEGGEEEDKRKDDPLVLNEFVLDIDGDKDSKVAVVVELIIGPTVDVSFERNEPRPLPVL
jgi:hypothetical protein